MTYGHAPHLLTRCRCEQGYVSALLNDGTPVCAPCSLEEEKKS